MIIIIIIVGIFLSVLVGCVIYSFKHSTNLEKENKKESKKDYYVGMRWENTYFMEHGCPFCGTNSFIEGPSGGMCINIICSNCYAKFNSMGPFEVELLEKPKNTKYSNGAID